MNVESLLKLNLSKQEDAKNWVDKQEKEQESSYVGQLRKGIYERIEEDTQIFQFL